MSRTANDHKNGGHGVCVKSLDGKVISQNSKCIEICGEMVGEICKKGCMSNCSVHPDTPAVDEGISCEFGIQSEGHLVDAVLVNDGENLTTYLLNIEEIVGRKIDFLKPYRLSPAEKKVAALLLAGRTNREIAAALFVSVSTVRTHIGSINRKVPKEVGVLVFRKNR